MTFLEKYEFLKKSVPIPALMNKKSINCDTSEYCYQSKNCFSCFIGDHLINSMYTTIGWGNKLVDCTSVTESEKCYKCLDSSKCFNGTYLMDCNNCIDCHFSAFLNSCTDCFGCIALTHKKYCIFNKQFSKEEYFEKVTMLKREKPEKILEQLFALKQQIPHPASQQVSSQNCPYGNYIYNSKNCYWVFNSYYCENSCYSELDSKLKNCIDTYGVGRVDDKNNYTERCYELTYSSLISNCYNCAYLTDSEGCANCYYGKDLASCADCFGCVGLTNKKYCILNNQLTKSQYEKAVKLIKKELGWRI